MFSTLEITIALTRKPTIDLLTQDAHLQEPNATRRCKGCGLSLSSPLYQDLNAWCRLQICRSYRCTNFRTDRGALLLPDLPRRGRRLELTKWSVKTRDQVLPTSTNGSSHVLFLFVVNKHDADISVGQPQSEQEPGFGLFIRNMVFEANEDHLREAYEKFGEIAKVAIARDARGLSRG